MDGFFFFSSCAFFSRFPCFSQKYGGVLGVGGLRVKFDWEVGLQKQCWNKSSSMDEKMLVIPNC